MRTASIAAFAALVGVAATLAFRRTLLAEGPAGLTVQTAAFALMVWARTTFGRRSFHAAADPTAGALVTTGPYRHLRHPIYAAILYFVWAGIATHPSAIGALLGVAATAATIVRCAAEESFLAVKYPEYRGYAAKTKRLVPFVY